ncbi:MULTISPECIES: DUF2087 domain-containing protein [Halanaerobiaceae]|nr:MULTISPECIES: DUF2087 domain-containing protein [Halanaerobiaceae]
MIKDKYKVTKEESEKVFINYFKVENGNEILSTLPSKEKKKVIVLKYIMKNFEASKKYDYKQINRKLKEIYSDYATIRRHLIDYGFMERTRDCKYYWVNERM